MLEPPRAILAESPISQALEIVSEMAHARADCVWFHHVKEKIKDFDQKYFVFMASLR